MHPSNARARRVEAIQKSVAHYFDLKVKDLLSSSRPKKTALARQIAMYLVREKLGMSFREIATFFGDKNHTTVMHAWRQVKTESRESEEVRLAVGDLIERSA